MGVEKEQKFFLKGLPDGLGNGVHIFQGYLSADDLKISVRMEQNGSDEVCSIIHKNGARQEDEFSIPKTVFDVLWKLTEGRRIEKVCYKVSEPGGLVWEIDQYYGKLKGIILCGVELSNEAQDLPDIIQSLLDRKITYNHLQK